ncbi:cytochrome oxidase putative small subunit CydP [Microbulbifer sp. SA54]|uniref:cytochrome oxidase putative small subunit CydP n=1 Tax=Microbulbifer sp. SA54 TaxID=3401577 RepID=UPI003AAD0F63
MTLADRRLLLELGAVLIIKLILIALLKIFFFSPDPEKVEPVPARLLHSEANTPPRDHGDKER